MTQISSVTGLKGGKTVTKNVTHGKIILKRKLIFHGNASGQQPLLVLILLDSELKDRIQSMNFIPLTDYMKTLLADVNLNSNKEWNTTIQQQDQRL